MSKSDASGSIHGTMRPVLSMTEACAYIEERTGKPMPRSTLNGRVRRGEVKARRTSAGWMLERADLDAVYGSAHDTAAPVLRLMSREEANVPYARAVKRARARCGMTQEEFAAALRGLGIAADKYRVSKIEAGVDIRDKRLRIVPAYVAEAAARVAGVTLAELLAEDAEATV